MRLLGTDVSRVHWNAGFRQSGEQGLRRKPSPDGLWAHADHVCRRRATTPAIAIASALKAVGGKVDNVEGFRQAMLKADYKLTRGDFKFGKNQHPVQDWYAMKVEKDASANIVLKTREKI